MDAPKTIHGFTILLEREIPKRPASRAGRVILVYRGAEYMHRYVVACQFRDDAKWDESWNQGDYYETASEADDAFTQRVRRNCDVR